MKKHMGDDDYKEFIKCLGNTKKFRNSDSKEWFETQRKQIEDAYHRIMEQAGLQPKRVGRWPGDAGDRWHGTRGCRTML